MPAGSLHSSLPLIDLQNYQGMQRKRRKEQRKRRKRGDLYKTYTKTVRLCVFRIYIHPYIYLKVFYEIVSKSCRKEQKIAIKMHGTVAKKLYSAMEGI